MKYVLVLVCMIGVGVAPLHAQSMLDHYVRIGLANNRGVRQQEFYLEKSLSALQEAKALYYPNISVQATYTRAGGGRTVDLPVGDLMNPVYATLNQLTRTTSFPQIENQTILLNPNNFYDARLHVTMPLINAELSYNESIKEQQTTLQQIEIAIYKRELVRDIKSGYYRYMQAVDARTIYRAALSLAQEALRVNQALFANGKANRTALLRSENEIAKYTAQSESAEETIRTAQAYFNFLLNLPATTTIMTDTNKVYPASVVSIDTTAISGREELSKLGTARSLQQSVKSLHSSYLIPKVNVFADAGSQAFDWKVNNKSAYYFAGISFQWDIFDAGTHKHREAQAQNELNALIEQTDYVRQQLQLQLTTARNAHSSALSMYRASLVQVANAERYYQDVKLLHSNGQALLIELFDAQQQLTSARLQSSIALYDTYIKLADIERATASFMLK